MSNRCQTLYKGCLVVIMVKQWQWLFYTHAEIQPDCKAGVMRNIAGCSSLWKRYLQDD